MSWRYVRAQSSLVALAACGRPITDFGRVNKVREEIVSLTLMMLLQCKLMLRSRRDSSKWMRRMGWQKMTGHISGRSGCLP